MHTFSLRPQKSGFDRKKKKKKSVKRVVQRDGILVRLTDVRLQLTSESLDGNIVRVGLRQWLISVPDLFNAFREVVDERQIWLANVAPADRQRIRTMLRRYGQLRVGS